MRAILLPLLLTMSLACWSDDAPDQGGPPDPSTIDLAYGVGIPFLFHARLKINPFAGTGPVHFETLNNVPYYAHEAAIEYGIRIGLAWPITDTVQFVAEFPYIANPYPQLTAAPSGLPAYDFSGHLEAAIGIKLEF